MKQETLGNLHQKKLARSCFMKQMFYPDRWSSLLFFIKSKQGSRLIEVVQIQVHFFFD